MSQTSECPADLACNWCFWGKEPREWCGRAQAPTLGSRWSSPKLAAPEGPTQLLPLNPQAFIAVGGSTQCPPPAGPE